MPKRPPGSISPQPNAVPAPSWSPSATAYLPPEQSPHRLNMAQAIRSEAGPDVAATAVLQATQLALPPATATQLAPPAAPGTQLAQHATQLAPPGAIGPHGDHAAAQPDARPAKPAQTTVFQAAAPFLPRGPARGAHTPDKQPGTTPAGNRPPPYLPGPRLPKAANATPELPTEDGRQSPQAATSDAKAGPPAASDHDATRLPPQPAAPKHRDRGHPESSSTTPLGGTRRFGKVGLPWVRAASPRQRAAAVRAEPHARPLRRRKALRPILPQARAKARLLLAKRPKFRVLPRPGRRVQSRPARPHSTLTWLAKALRSSSKSRRTGSLGALGALGLFLASLCLLLAVGHRLTHQLRVSPTRVAAREKTGADLLALSRAPTVAAGHSRFAILGLGQDEESGRQIVWIRSITTNRIGGFAEGDRLFGGPVRLQSVSVTKVTLSYRDQPVDVTLAP